LIVVAKLECKLQIRGRKGNPPRCVGHVVEQRDTVLLKATVEKLNADDFRHVSSRCLQCEPRPEHAVHTHDGIPAIDFAQSLRKRIEGAMYRDLILATARGGNEFHDLRNDRGRERRPLDRDGDQSADDNDE
jgi:hypothetical protein